MTRMELLNILLLLMFWNVNTANCGECLDLDFRCADGSACIPNIWMCDGDHDCGDQSDERECPEKHECDDTYFKCISHDHCVPMMWLCDGQNDCLDSSDEVNCTHTCQPNEFQCNDDECIPGILRCDKNVDCTDKSDEDDCPQDSKEATTESTTKLSPEAELELITTIKTKEKSSTTINSAETMHSSTSKDNKICTDRSLNFGLGFAFGGVTCICLTLFLLALIFLWKTQKQKSKIGKNENHRPVNHVYEGITQTQDNMDTYQELEVACNYEDIKEK